MTELDPKLRQRISALGEPALPEAIWLRVDAGRRSRARRFKSGLTAGCLSLVVAAGAVLLTPQNAPLVHDAGVASNSTPSPAQIQAQLQAVDQALQNAYANGSKDAEIEPLWVLRRSLTRTLQNISTGTTSGQT